MARWRTKACEMFGFPPGSYSYSSGAVRLMDDLLELTRHAARDGDETTLGKVLDYVKWAASQKGAPGLSSAVDLAFFLRGFRDAELCALLKAKLPVELAAEKWQMLIEEPAD